MATIHCALTSAEHVVGGKVDCERNNQMEVGVSGIAKRESPF